jgi:hypothetical protein
MLWARGSIPGSPCPATRQKEPQHGGRRGECEDRSPSCSGRSHYSVLFPTTSRFTELSDPIRNAKRILPVRREASHIRATNFSTMPCCSSESWPVATRLRRADLCGICWRLRERSSVCVVVKPSNDGWYHQSHRAEPTRGGHHGVCQRECQLCTPRGSLLSVCGGVYRRWGLWIRHPRT